MSNFKNFVLIDWHSKDESADISANEELKSNAEVDKKPWSSQSFYGSGSQKKLHLKPNAHPKVLFGNPSTKRGIAKRSRSHSSSHSRERKAKRPAARAFRKSASPHYSRLDVKIMKDGKEVDNEGAGNLHSGAPGNISKKDSATLKWTMRPSRGRNFEMKFKLSHDIPLQKKAKDAKHSIKPKPSISWPSLDVSVVKVRSPLSESSQHNTSPKGNLNHGFDRKTSHSEPVLIHEKENSADLNKMGSDKSGHKQSTIMCKTNKGKVQASPNPKDSVNKESSSAKENINNDNQSCDTNVIVLADSGGFDDIEQSKNGKDNCLLAAVKDVADENTAKPYYPIFEVKPTSKKTPEKKSTTPPKPKQSPKFLNWKAHRSGDGLHQMIIDAGQRDIGPKKCRTCGMLYSIGNPEDEMLHARYHAQVVEGLAYAGWKKEKILGLYSDGRIIGVRPSDPKFMLKKVESVLAVIDEDLGISNSKLPLQPNSLFLLFVSAYKRVVGCLIAEPIFQAYQIKCDAPCPDNVRENIPRESYYLDSEPVKAVCGINRIWTLDNYRRKNIATRLLDILRYHFNPNDVLSIRDLAFSDPTESGRLFAQKYTGFKNFLVYK